MGYVLIGVVIGSIISNVIFAIRYRSVGVLRIDHSNPEKDKYLFDIPILDILDKKKRVMLKVDNKADLSHE